MFREFETGEGEGKGRTEVKMVDILLAFGSKKVQREKKASRRRGVGPRGQGVSETGKEVITCKVSIP